MEVLIAGAGIAGLAAASLLAARGADVTVFERSRALREVGAGIQISANAGHVIDALGLGEDVRRVAIQPGTWRMRLHTGELVAELELGERHKALHGQPYLMIHRAGLQKMMIDRLAALAPGALRLGVEVKGFSQTVGRVTLRLSDGAEATGDVLIAADGVKSALRVAIAGPDRPIYTGSSAWRVLLPADRLPDDFCANGPNLFMGQGRHMVQYRVRDADGREYLNYVAPVEQPPPDEESWTIRRPWEDMKRDFAGWCDEVQLVMDRTDRDACYLWSLNIREPLSHWSSGHAVLIGDAAHPTLPYIAQGAAMALEDAAVLARALDDGAGDIPAALAAFEAIRRPRATRVVEAANTIARTFHGAGERDLRADLHRGASSLEARDAWLYNYNPVTATSPAANPGER